MFPTLTKKQKEILDYIKVYSQLHGYAPSLQEIKDQFRLSAISTVHEHIQNLKNKGFIQKEINQARSIRTVESDLRANEFIQIPVNSEISADLKLRPVKKVEVLQMHKNTVKAMGKYFGVKISNEAYKFCGVFNGDILLLKEQATAEEKDTILFSTDGNKFELGKVVSARNGYVIRPLINEEGPKAYHKLTVAGIIVCLIRNFI